VSRRVDPGRLLRALDLEVEGPGPDMYSVSGGERPHIVQVRERDPWVCDCVDAAYRPGTCCKHLVAVYLTRQLAAPVRRALRQAVGAS